MFSRSITYNFFHNFNSQRGINPPYEEWRFNTDASSSSLRLANYRWFVVYVKLPFVSYASEEYRVPLVIVYLLITNELCWSAATIKFVVNQTVFDVQSD